MRPVTKSPPIQFRLPVDLYAKLVRKAESKQMTPAQYVADYLTRALEQQL